MTKKKHQESNPHIGTGTPPIGFQIGESQNRFGVHSNLGTNRYVSFTHTFQYLGSLINYSLRNDDDITAQIASATAVMGALKEVWRNPHLDAYNMYLLF